MYEYFVIGDASIDRTITITDPDVVRSVDTANYTVTFPFPAKLRLENPPAKAPGGNAINASVTMAKLGVKVGVYSIVGDNESGRLIENELRSANVDTANFQIQANTETNNSYIINIDKDRLILSHHHPRTYQLSTMPETKNIYFTSTGEGDKELMQKVIEYRQQHKDSFLLFAPGTKHLELPFPEIKPLLEVTDLLILNKREAMLMSRLQTQSNENLLQGLFRLGTKRVIMTRSEHGSIAYDGQNYFKVGALTVESIDFTGAGDTYAATVGAMLSKGKDLQTAMQYAAINAALTTTVNGGTRGQLDWNTLESKYAEFAPKLVYAENMAG